MAVCILSYQLHLWTLIRLYIIVSSCLLQADASPEPRQPVVAPGNVTKRHEVMDDFLRNFFVRAGLTRTSEAFEAEWYEKKATGRMKGSDLVPEVYLNNLVRLLKAS